MICIGEHSQSFPRVNSIVLTQKQENGDSNWSICMQEIQHVHPHWQNQL